MSKLSVCSDVATIAASVVAIVTLGMGGYQFHENQKLQKEVLDYQLEAQTVSLMSDYYALKKKRNYYKIASKLEKNEILNISEAIFNARKDSPEWRETVLFILNDSVFSHGSILLNCKTYSEDFVELVQAVWGRSPCDR